MQSNRVDNYPLLVVMRELYQQISHIVFRDSTESTGGALMLGRSVEFRVEFDSRVMTLAVRADSGSVMRRTTNSV